MKTIAQMATISGRNNSRLSAISSLMKQVDELHLIYNGGVFYENNEHIGRKFYGIVQHYPNGAGQIPLDGWKFYNVNQHQDAYILICDDDIAYPDDFADVMRAKVDEYGRSAVVTCMGKILKPRPIESYYKDELTCYRTFMDNDIDVPVEIPGTCAMAFHSSLIATLDHTFFESMNSDIWMGVWCKQNNVPAIVIQHRGDWLKDLTPMNQPGTWSVYGTYNENDKEMTDVVNRYFV